MFKSGGPEHPLRRVKDLVRYAELVGLAQATGSGRVELTDAGQQYVEVASDADSWTVNDGQAGILTEQLVSHHDEGALQGAALALSLLASSPPDREISRTDVGSALATAADRSGWSSERTLYHQGARFAGLLEDMRLIDGGHHVTEQGRATLRQLNVPSHPPFDELVVEPQPDTGDQAWIFQANPRYYDIARAVRSLREMNWLVAQSRHEIKSGHRVYIWQSGQTGGIVAIGTVLTEPEPSASQEGAEFIVDRAKFEGEQLRVRLSIDRVLDEPISRTALREHPVLKDLPILRFANATNFKLSREHDRALRELIQSPLTAGAAVWWVNQGSHYREERDGGFVWAPLRSKSGQVLGHWESLRQAEVGDRILHYANGRIRALGEVTGSAEESARPEGLSEEAWAQEGIMVSVRYSELSEPVGLEDVPLDWRLSQGPPFTNQGSVQQGYFFRLSDDFVSRLALRFPQVGLAGGTSSPGPDYQEPDFSSITEYIRNAGLSISDQALRRYHLSLKTRGFVILPGVSGTGKTWLAELYAQAVGANHLLVPVAPNWTTNEDLLGYLNPLNGQFQFTEYTAFIREAATEYENARREGRQPRPFHVTLDEMNLARVEYYFARFLSAMEVRDRNQTATIELAPGHEVLLTPNLFFSGTVNVDETTHGFADKVYDRAQLVELEAPRDAIETKLEGRPYGEVLVTVWDAVRDVAPFAFRVIDDIGTYVEASEAMDVAWETALDEQLLQKVLPKVKGADLRIDDCLKRLIEITDGQFPLTHAKARTMHDGFIQHQFASYF